MSWPQAIGEVLGPLLPVVLAVPRTVGLFLFFPLFGSALFPMRVRMACSLALAVAMVPALSGTPFPTEPVGALGFALQEGAVGLLFGFGARAILSAAESSSVFLANQAGFAVASQVDPLSGSPSLVTATFHALLATALFFAADFHHLLIRAVAHSYTALPPGEVLAGTVLQAGSAGEALGQAFFGLALALAGPALLLTMASDLVLVLAGKAMPQVPILIVAYPIKLGVGMAAIALLSLTIQESLPLFARLLQRLAFGFTGS